MKKQHLSEKISVFMQEPRQCDLEKASAPGRHTVSRQHDIRTAPSGVMATGRRLELLGWQPEILGRQLDL